MPILSHLLATSQIHNIAKNASVRIFNDKIDGEYTNKTGQNMKPNEIICSSHPYLRRKFNPFRLFDSIRLLEQVLQGSGTVYTKLSHIII